MVDTIDLCSDEDVLLQPSISRGSQSPLTTQCFTPLAVKSTLPAQSETSSENERIRTPTFSTPTSESCTSGAQAYKEEFYIDFITTIEHAFPWLVFAERHRVSENDLRHLFFVLVTLPLSDPDDNKNRLKVAQGARKRFSEWRQAWEETVANIRAGCTETEDAKRAYAVSTTG